MVWWFVVLIVVAVVSFAAGWFIATYRTPHTIARMSQTELASLGGKVYDIKQGVTGVDRDPASVRQ